MGTSASIEAKRDTVTFDNAVIGEGALIEPDVMVGFRREISASEQYVQAMLKCRRGSPTRSR